LYLVFIATSFYVPAGSNVSSFLQNGSAALARNFAPVHKNITAFVPFAASFASSLVEDFTKHVL
jgi:hypothetical protein